MTLLIKALNEELRELYNNHKAQHKDDSGIDLYVNEDITINSGETKTIDFNIQCKMDDNKSYYLYPRSSISKTPLIMHNSVGIIDAGYRGNIMMKVTHLYKPNYYHNIFNTLIFILNCIIFLVNIPLSKIINYCAEQRNLSDDEKRELKNMKLNHVKYYTDSYTVTRGTRFGQICRHDLSPFMLRVVEELDETDRGKGGFGSTD